MKILIAEDDFTSRTILQAVTSKWGFESVCVEDGEAAWEVFQQQDSPQLLLLDWEMPKLSGFELCQRIRQQETSNPPFIILLTARTETADVVEGLVAGANDYIAKPFENSELKARLQVGQRMLELQQELLKAKSVLSREKEVIENIILKMRASHPIDLANIQILDMPVEKISGDILLSSFRPNGSQHLMLGDFTGHGLTAAIGGPTVSDTFYSMTQKNLSMEIIINEINQKLCEKMPVGIFCGAVFVELSKDRKQASIWNCGMENVLIYREKELFTEVSSNNLALGIVSKKVTSPIIMEVENGDKIYAYSDGITETMNHKNEEFGATGLQQTISGQLSSNEEISALAEILLHFRGDGEQLDDITLVELNCAQIK